MSTGCRRINSPKQPVVIRTLGDLGPQAVLHAVCEACQHTVELDILALICRYHPGQKLDHLSRRLRCQACGARHPQAHLMHSWDAGTGALYRPSPIPGDRTRPAPADQQDDCAIPDGHIDAVRDGVAACEAGQFSDATAAYILAKAKAGRR